MIMAGVKILVMDIRIGDINIVLKSYIIGKKELEFQKN